MTPDYANDAMLPANDNRWTMQVSRTEHLFAVGNGFSVFLYIDRDGYDVVMLAA